jgi:hypothetical protein
LQASEKSRDVWATATGEDGGLPVVFRYRQNRPFAMGATPYPSALRVLWEFDASVRNGMPSPDTNELQVVFEDALAPIGEGETGFLMLVFTGNGRKEWLYYVTDPGVWLDRLNALLVGHQPYPLQIEDWPDDDWSTWQDFADSVRVAS